MPTDSKAPKTPATKAITAKVKVESYDLSRSNETLDLAKDLAKFIKDNKLTTQVQGKDFVNVEGWQYAGSRLGIVPIVEHVLNVSSAEELKYQANVTLFDLRHGTTVGAGFAVCSNKESGKKFYQEFAIMSMAQTRAIGKAYRNCLAWIIRAAGYEPTPAEEMQDAGTGATVVETPKKPQPEAAAPASAPLAASVTSDPNSDPTEILAELRAAFAETKSTIALRELWEGPAKPFQRELLADKDAAKVRIDAAVRATASTKAAPAITPPANRPAADEAGQVIVYATAEQVQEYTRLLNHPQIKRPEKTKGLIALNRLTSDEMATEIVFFQGLIDEREGYDRAEGLRRSLVGFATQHRDQIGPGEFDRLNLLAEDGEMTEAELQAELDAARAMLDELQPAA